MTFIVDSMTWLVLVPMLMANPDPEKVAYWRALMFCFSSYMVSRFFNLMVDESARNPPTVLLHLTLTPTCPAATRRQRRHDSGRPRPQPPAATALLGRWVGSAMVHDV